MRLLLTADLHYRIHWFRWLIEQAPDFDLICIAGDLLDIFNTETRLEQAREVRTLIRELADLLPVAVCTGNHDNAGGLVAKLRAVWDGLCPAGAAGLSPAFQRREHPSKRVRPARA